MADEEHKIGVKCCSCSKKVTIKASFTTPTDITHVVEMVMKLEEKGWKCPTAMLGYGTTEFRVQPRCEACDVAGGNSRRRR
jgi:hypothetical protein